jgi:hypothetical protein
MKLKLGTAILAATALAFAFGATNARADYLGGGPVKTGKSCWQATDGLEHGFWKACPKPPKAAKKGKKGGKKAGKKSGKKAPKK